MKKTMVLLLLVAALSMLVLPTYAAFDELRLGARPMGFGGAFTAVAEDANAVYWNPAGMPFGEGVSITSMYANKYGIEDYDLNFVAGSVVLRSFAFGAASITEKTLLQEENDEEIVTNRFAEDRLLFAVAKQFANKFSVGLTLKSLGLETTEGNYSGLAGDLGLMVALDEAVKFGFTAKNFFGEVKDEKAAKSYHAGVSFQAKDSVLVSGELSLKDDPQGSEETVFGTHFGAEYKLYSLSLRAGFDQGDFCGGLGYEYRGITFDYGFSQHELGNTHRVSAGFKF